MKLSKMNIKQEVERLELKYISSIEVMSDAELQEATRNINKEMRFLMLAKKKMVADEFGLKMTNTERAIQHYTKELINEGYKNENIFDKNIFNAELKTRLVKWAKKFYKRN